VRNRRGSGYNLILPVWENYLAVVNGMMLYICKECSKHCHQWGNGVTFLPCPEGRVVFWYMQGGYGHKFFRVPEGTLLGEEHEERYVRDL
jgi:hypothetical protein